MIANNLTISIPFNGCNKQCPYCISKMTGYINPEYSIEFKLSQMIKKITKVSQIALMSGVTSVLITSKGEPLLNMVAVKYFLEKFANFKTELQTNGELLTEEILDSLDENLDILSISIDNTADLNKFIPILEYIHNNNLSFIVRFTYNVINYNNFILFYDLVTFCKKYNVRQLTFRQVSIPEFGIVNTEEAKNAIHYIKEEIPRDNINNFFEFLDEKILTLKLKSELVFESEVGKIYDYDGISIMTINNCIQNRANENMIRSLIFKEDGHLYTSWNSNASIIL
jgi:sulfatase maturation enzyme AslB (radical SAM superfamily)